MNYKVIRIIGVVLLVLGATAIVFRAIAAGVAPIVIGGILLGHSFRLEKKSKASGDPSSTP